MTPTITEELKIMSARLRELFPESRGIMLQADILGDGTLSQGIALHQIGDYAVGQAILRRCGCGDREKRPHPGGSDNIAEDWTTLHGEVGGVHVTAFCDGLPPSCRIETVTKTVPETVPTGRMVEVEERVVKCGGEAA